jgi:hypothetical protein
LLGVKSASPFFQAHFFQAPQFCTFSSIFTGRAGHLKPWVDY